MNWQYGNRQEQWLVSEDGEILERVRKGFGSEWLVVKTGRVYATEEAAKTAAESECLNSDIRLATVIEQREKLRAQRAKVLEVKVQQLKTVPMKYRRMAFNAQLQKENETLRAQLAEIAASEPVGKVVSSGPANLPVFQWLSADHSLRCNIGDELFTRPMSADVTELVELLEFMWRDVPMNEYAFEKLEAALSKYKGAKL